MSSHVRPCFGTMDAQVLTLGQQLAFEMATFGNLKLTVTSITVGVWRPQRS